MVKGSSAAVVDQVPFGADKGIAQVAIEAAAHG